jgi:hypothetical protein
MQAEEAFRVVNIGMELIAQKQEPVEVEKRLLEDCEGVLMKAKENTENEEEEDDDGEEHEGKEEE